MPRVRPLEVRALLPLLGQDWETVEELAEALILELDKVRASRTSYVAILRLRGIMIGMGPYPGQKTAMRALETHPAWGDPIATGWAVVPIESPEGYDRRLKALDLPPTGKTA